MKRPTQYPAVILVGILFFVIILIYAFQEYSKTMEETKTKTQIAAEYSRSVQIYEQKVRDKPKDAQAHYELGLAYKQAYEDSWHNLGDKYKNLAVKAFEDAIEIRSDYGEAHFALGELCSRYSETRKKGLEALENAVKLMPDCAKAYHHLGLAYGYCTFDQIFLPKYIEYSAFKDAAKKKGEDLWELQQHQEQELTEIYSKNAFVHKSIDAHIKALSIDPNYPEAHEALIKWFIRIGERNRAFKQIEALRKCGELGEMRATKQLERLGER